MQVVVQLLNLIFVPFVCVCCESSCVLLLWSVLFVCFVCLFVFCLSADNQKLQYYRGNYSKS